MATTESGNPYIGVKEISEEEAQKYRLNENEFGDKAISAGESIEVGRDGVFYHCTYKRYYQGIRKE